MQSLANYRQTALEQFNELIVLSQSVGNIEFPTTSEVWGRILLGTLVVLVYWSMMEE